MKKRAEKILLGTLLTVFLFFGVAVYAEEQQEIVSPESELYETTRLMEDTEYEYTEDNGEKALLQDEYADKRLLEAEELLENDNEEAAEAILEDYNEHVEEVEQNLDEARKNGGEISDIEALVAEKFAKRSEKLTALLEREDLPQQAKEGISRALTNQEKAAQRFADALQKAREAREQAQERANEAREQAGERAEAAREQAEERAEAAREQAEDRVSETREQAEERASEIKEQVKEKPDLSDLRNRSPQSPGRVQ